jgi:hypothetical protein
MRGEGGARWATHDKNSALGHRGPERAMTMKTIGVLLVSAMSTTKQPNLKALYAATVDARSSLPNYIERRSQPPRRSK